WHPGVLGIAASRLVHRYRVPVFLVSLQGPLARGSARSPRGTNLLALLEQAAPWLLTFGGHKCAAGFSIDPLQFPTFQDALLKANREDGALVTEETLGLDGALDP